MIVRSPQETLEEIWRVQITELETMGLREGRSMGSRFSPGHALPDVVAGAMRQWEAEEALSRAK